MTRTGAGAARAGGAFRWLGLCLAWTVIVSALAAITAAVLIPRIGGATPYTVLTGSMQPNYPPGTLVVVKPVAAEDIGVGSVITYQLKSGEPAVVTHRVVTVTQADGQPAFQTQGDANNAVDPDWVAPVQIRGKLWYAVPYLGYLNTMIEPSQRQQAGYVVAGLLVAYAASMFAGAARDRRPRPRHAAARKEVRT
ncbi:MAG: signal peptidase I [Nocardioides sp.]